MSEKVLFISARPIAPVGLRVRSVLFLILGLLASASCALVATPAAAVEPPSEWATNVTATSATLNAQVNPKDTATTYRFEYADSEAALLNGKGMIAPTPPVEGDAGSGVASVIVQVHLQGLSSHRSYWYRVIIRNSGGEAPACEAAGSCPTFMTQAASEPGLAEDRVWELVSPAVKDGALILPLEEGGGLVQAAENGEAVTYLSVGSTKSEPGEQPSGGAGESQILSIRSQDGGWSSWDMATAHEATTGVVGAGSGQEYRWFSPNLSVGLVEPLGTGENAVNAEGAALLSSGASEKTIYLRDDLPLRPFAGTEQLVYNDAAHEAAVPDSEAGYLPLVTGCSVSGVCRTQRVQELADVPPGTEFGVRNSEFLQGVIFLGATPDGNHVVFYTKTPLAPGVKGGALYQWNAGASASEPGRLQLASIATKNGTEEQALGVALGAYTSSPEKPINARGAISSDGSRIVFSDSLHHLFMRDTLSERTTQLDEVEPGVTPSTPEAEFQFASGDGSKVFFTDGEKLTATSHANGSNGRDLYECEVVEEVPGKLKCDLKDLTAGAIGAGVQGFVLIGSDESSSLYFVATADLTSEENEHGERAIAGADNLYALHYNDEVEQWEMPVLVAVLSGKDGTDWASTQHFESGLEDVTSRVSPNGEYLAFMSERSLTGYDNIDASSPPSEPRRDEEVYLYRSQSGSASTGSLVCVSCNPTGERPSGVFDSESAREGEHLLVDRQKIWAGEGRWLAGSVPGWTATASTSAQYQSRYLSNEGRVFFDSSDGLAPPATNGLENVYEYRPTHIGGCGEANGTFDLVAEGCITLISSGKSNEESVFLDSGGSGPGGEEGEDAFFLTSQSLVRTDKDTAFDVYDAHVCRVQSPCVGEAAGPPPCGVAESCRVAPTLLPSIYGAPSSATFTGEGNPLPLVTPPSSSRDNTLKMIKCSKGKRLRHGQCIRSSSKSRTREKGRRERGRPGRVNRKRRAG